MGLFFGPLSITALVGVADHDAGVASALVNTTQQIGGSLGTALLVTFATTATTNYFGSHAAHATNQSLLIAQASVHGYVTAFIWSAVILGAATLVVATLVKARKDDLPAGGAVHMG